MNISVLKIKVDINLMNKKMSAVKYLKVVDFDVRIFLSCLEF